MPGIGLIILRLAVSSFLFRECLAILAGAIDVKSAIPPIIAAGLGILLLVGLATPVAGALADYFSFGWRLLGEPSRGNALWPLPLQPEFLC